MSQQETSLSVTNGAAAAAFLAAAIGVFSLGLITLAGEFGWFSAPELVKGVGGLSGRSTMAVAIWLIAWAVLHRQWRDRQLSWRTLTIASFGLIGLGVVFALPPVWHLLGA
ncbi:MAG: hypothetical protein HY870_06580 [Chloroflexi bacterium]|nr:hypothetical protein [Chloroflexota bacterium]